MAILQINNQSNIDLTNAMYIGRGSERSVYIHPNDPQKLIKVIRNGRKDIQTKRETKSYKKLAKRLANTDKSWKHLPRYYGECSTNLGKGQVVEAIRDYDGKISKTLQYYIELNGVEPYRHALNELKSYLLNNLIIINHDISSLLNIVVKKETEENYYLILIDALGDHTAIKILNVVPTLARQKINRRWDKLEKKLPKAKK